MNVPHDNILMIPVAECYSMTQKHHAERSTNKRFLDLYSAMGNEKVKSITDYKQNTNCIKVVLSDF